MDEAPPAGGTTSASAAALATLACLPLGAFQSAFRAWVGNVVAAGVLGFAALAVMFAGRSSDRPRAVSS